MDSSPSAAVQSTPQVPNDQVLEIISLKVMKDQMDSQKYLVSMLMSQSLQFTASTYTREGVPTQALPGGTIDVSM